MNKTARLKKKKSACKNQWHLHTLKRNYPKQKQQQQNIYNTIKKNKTVRNKFDQGGKRFVYWEAQSMMKQTTEDTNKWKDSKHLILLKCLCYPRWVTDSMAFQNTNGSLYRNRTNNPIICMETQETLDAQNNLKKEEHGWWHHISWFQNIWQSYSTWNSKVLT